MPRLLFAVIPILIVLAASACGGGGGSASPTPEATRTPVSGALPISPPDSIEEFLAQYEDERIVRTGCTLDFAAGLVDCGENGLYAPSHLPIDEAAECDVLLVDEEPIAVTCTSQEPLTVIYYAVAL